MALIASVVVSALGQYPGQVKKKSKDSPDLRAIAVLEWTGDLGKPKACRMVPVTVFDGEKLQDGGVYLARPEPLAVAGEVEYELKENGKTVGLFDIENAGQEQGSWVGYGKWKPLPQPKAPKCSAEDRRRRGGVQRQAGAALASTLPAARRADQRGQLDHGIENLQSAPGEAATIPTVRSCTRRPDGQRHHHEAEASSPRTIPDRPKLEKKPETFEDTHFRS